MIFYFELSSQYLIYKEDVLIKGYVACNHCNGVFKQSKDSSTKNLITHIDKCTKNKQTDDSSTLLTQTSISNKRINIDQTMAVKKVKQEHKALVTTALSQMSILDFRPFSTCIGVGFRLYSQTLIDIAARIGIN